LHPYVRPVRAAVAAGHHGCARTCRAPIWTACSRHKRVAGIARAVLDHSLSHHASSVSCRTVELTPVAYRLAAERHAAASAEAMMRPVAW
jgi:hypothetical protein